MKNLLLLPAILFSLFSFAQNNHSRPIAALTRNEATADVLLGTIADMNTSKERVLLDPRLVAQSADCIVSGFSFSMSAGNKSWGPVTVQGPKLTDEIKDKIIEWDSPNVTITIDGIRLKCNGQETTARPVVLKYDH